MRHAFRPLCTTLALGAVASFGLTARSAAQTELPKSSPFMSADAPASAGAPGETIEFAAVRTIGTHTEIDLYDTQGRKHHWIPVGATVDGLKVISYDAHHDQISADLGGVKKQLTLRRPKSGFAGTPGMPMPTVASFATPTPTPPPAPVAPVATPTASVAELTLSPAAPAADAAPAATSDQPAKPLSVARQEEEARMLVSDLLEIGMAQRKAYEDKQKQATDPNAAPTPAAPGAPAAPAAPEANGPSSGG